MPDYEIITQKLKDKFGEENIVAELSYDMLSVTIAAEQNLKVLQFLFDDEELKFRFLSDLTGAHYPDNKDGEISVIYHLHNLVDNIRLRVKLYVPVAKPDVYSATALYSGANWMERETYDFYGINFIGHPNLIRVLNVDEMDYFPMRKEFPLEDQTRLDKDDEMFGRSYHNLPISEISNN